MKPRKCLFAALLCAALPLTARAAQLGARFETVSRQFAADAAAKLPDLNPAAVAVFPFAADDALARRKVNVAVEELLTEKLLREPRFRLLERGRLDDVLREQKLGLSGAIDSGTAAQVGKLAGVRLAVLGTVTRLGRSYQISAKLVDTETSDVVSASIVEVPADVFDEEASRYLVLVPDTQTISLYLAVGAAQMPVKRLGSQTAGSATAVPANVDAELGMDSGVYAGVGVKYFPFQNWDADLAIMPQHKIGDGKKSVVANLTNPGVLAAKAAGPIFRLLVNRRFPVSRYFKIYAGAGFMRYELDPSETEQTYNQAQGLTTGGSVSLVPGFGEGRYTTPLADLGLEWRPQARFGLSALATFPLNSANYKWEADLTDGSVTKRVTVWELSYPKYMLELNLAWYF